MNAFAQYLNALGGLHDAVVVDIDWHVEAKTLKLTLDDLYANFRGLPEYPGKRKGEILLRQVSHIDFDVEADEPLRVFEILPEEGSADTVIAKFTPAGRITIRFSSAEYPVSALLSGKPPAIP